MDALQQTIVRLSEHGITVKQIARRTGTSEQKVRRVLITMGLWSSPLSDRIHRMHASGKTLDEIAAALGMTRNKAWQRQLTTNGQRAARQLMRELDAANNDNPRHTRKP